MLFTGGQSQSADEAGLKVQFNRTKVCLQGITDEASIPRTPDKMYELVYLQNAQELAAVIAHLKIDKYYPWVFGQLNPEIKESKRRQQAKQVMNDYNHGQYVPSIN